MRISTLCLFVLFASGLVVAQNSQDRAYIISKTNVEKLNELSGRFNKSYIKSLQEAPKSISSQVLKKKGQPGYLSGFDENGLPVYDFDDNLNAAITSGANKIWIGGSGGYNLNGNNIEIGHWEASGLPLTTHQELNGKITHAESVSVSSHGTHTACTMIGTGISASARGMASGATIIARKSDNDEAELAAFGAAGGIISNHSYSSGDPNGNIPLYGPYTSNTAEWDEIFYYAPYLLACKSAGNNRNDGVNTADGGYDLIYTIASAKNLLTIGAVYDVPSYTGPSSVQQSAFSNWGPTDDWRIKPDITTNGTSLYSADSSGNTAYSIKSGTSMSAPTVAGSAALLQQHYLTLNNSYMKSATLKALLLCTTNELGAYDGPDFQSGWGLLNAERAAGVISNNNLSSIIKELSLDNGELYTSNIMVDGSTPLALTIVWTDPPGNPVTLSPDDQTPMLVNDLDVKISGNGNIYMPWLMIADSASANFNAAAVRGDNFRDNIERIDINSLPAGTYTVTVSHKGTLLNGYQDFSLVINGITGFNTEVGNSVLINENILIYPVPSNEPVLNIIIPQEYNSANYQIQLFDYQGKLIKSDSASGSQTMLNVSGIEPGLYCISIWVEDQFYLKKIVIN